MTLTDEQKQTCKAIVNVFETGRVAGDYGAVTILKGDAGHLTYGRSQTTLASGNLFLLIKAYCERADAQFASELQPFLPGLAARDVGLDFDMSLRETLRDAGADPAMQQEQNRFFDAHYFNPACSTAEARGITSPLGQAVIYDSFIHGGFARVTPLVAKTIGQNGVDEKMWIQDYVAARKRWLQGLKPPLPSTVYRMDAFNALIAENKWNLALTMTVRGVVISPDNLRDSTPVVRAAAVDPADPPVAPILFLTSPYMRGEEVRKVQEALNTNGLANQRDGIFGPFTVALVKKFQESKSLRVDGVVGPGTRLALGL
jgi:chitosanase